MKFGPLPANLHAGDVILWVNRDMFRHSATARDGSFAIDLPPKGSARTMVKRKGAIPFSCKYHPGMKGVLVSR
jgi:plastocyanin